jgi:hypothetical protein
VSGTADLSLTAAGRDLPLTAAGRAAVDRHRKALAAYADNPAEWRAAYPAMASAIIEAYTWRQSQPARHDPAGHGGQQIARNHISAV